MNLGDLRTAVQNLGYGTDTVAQQNFFINSVYREICSTDRWPFLEAQDSSLITVVGTPGYTLPMTNWRNLDAVRIEHASLSDYNNLTYLEPQDFREYEQVDQSTGKPCYWTFINQQLRFYPRPDDTYTVRVDYIIEPPDLALDADVPVLPVPYHDVLVWGAVEGLAYRERDWLGREFAQTKKEAMLSRMKGEYFVRQRQTSSHVKHASYPQQSYPFWQSRF